MSPTLARCALALVLFGWIAVVNERLGLVSTSFGYFDAYAIPVFVIAAAALVLLSRAFKDTIATRRSDWPLVVFRAVPRVARITFIVLLMAALAYMFLATGGSASAATWQAAGPNLRSALFAGFTIPALLAWVALLAAAQAAV